MKSDKNKTKDELIRELKALKKQFKEHTKFFEKECKLHDRAEEELRLAQVIIDNSPVVLFRRMAGEKPKLVYVSDNIRQMGYTAEEFLKEKIHFRDAVHPDDIERVAEEIGQRRLLWQNLAALAEVETKRGNAAAAGTARGRAREVIDYIVNHAGDDGLRESFLALPEVQSVLSSN